jgi:glycosyltransferase involved in cell wall biosynthesis
MELIANRQLSVGRASYEAGQQFTADRYIAQRLLREGKAYEATVFVPQSNVGLVSCIMPTKDRRTWIPRALECWQAQTYQPLQLVVLDNGSDPIKDLLPADPRIIYTRAGQGMKLGMLRNLACQLATGEFIAHWDDDDWYAPDRIEKQVQAIGGAAMCVPSGCHFAGEKQAYRLDADPMYGIGAGLLYRRDYWLKSRFAPVAHCGEDSMFIQQCKSKAHIDGYGLMVASVHDAHTAQRVLNRKCSMSELPKGYRWPSGL